MYVGSLPSVSNRATYVESFEVKDSDTGELVDLAGSTLIFELKDPTDKGVILTASSGNGITLPSLGIFEVRFTAGQMEALRANNYIVSVRATFANGDTEQVIIGELPVLEG